MPSIRRPLIAASLAALVTIFIAFVLPRDVALDFLGVILGVTAGVYLGFAIHDGRRREVGIEVIGLAIFSTLAVLGIEGRPGMLAAGFLLHIAWDFAHHPRGVQTKIVPWYPPACLVYDGLVGAFLVWLWWRR